MHQSDNVSSVHIPSIIMQSHLGHNNPPFSASFRLSRQYMWSMSSVVK